MSDDLLPLSKRPISALRSRADELRGMARTASTPQVRDALLRLADRFAALADERAASIGHARSEAAD